MKNIFKLTGIIAVAAITVFAMSACNGKKESAGNRSDVSNIKKQTPHEAVEVSGKPVEVKNLEDVKDFLWINKSEYKIENNILFIKATPKSDYFCDPVDGTSTATAPFLYREIKGDFLVSVRVKPVFADTYDACTIFVYADERHWLKTAFEYTDLGFNSIVTVKTEMYSDDANGVEIKDDAVYLQVIRKGDIFACHYSSDGIDYKMARLFKMAVPDTIKVGLSAQSPMGEGGFMEFSNLKITQTLPEDIRKSE